MPTPDRAPASVPPALDADAFLAQQAAILREAPDNEALVRQLLAAALQRISALEQQLAALTPPARPQPAVSHRPAIRALLQAQPAGLTRAQMEAALVQPGLGETLRRMVRDALLVRTPEGAYRLAEVAAPSPAAPATPVAAPPASRPRGGRPRARRPA